MRICIVSLSIAPYFRRENDARYGGAEAQAAFLAGALSSRGEDVTLVVADLPAGVQLPHPAHNAFRSSAGLPGLRFFHPRLTGILSALARADADVYYQRNAGMITGVTALFCRRRGRVFVYGAGSDTDLAFRTVRLDGLRDRSLYYLGLRKADGIVVQNRRQEALSQRRFHKPVKVIANGVSLSGDVGAGGRSLVLWVGAIRRVKQPEVFVELARRLPSMRFVLVGGKSLTEREFASQILASAASVPNLTLAGHVTPDEVLNYMDRAVALVNTSRVEGFPNAYLEAWSRGVPVVSLSDVDDLIAVEDVGCVCRTVDEIETAIRELAADPPRVAEMGERARTLVEKRFSAPVLAGEYLSFFDELLNRRKRKE